MMGKFIKIKSMYLIVFFIVVMLGFVIKPTFAKFVDGYVTSDDIVGFSLDFDVAITNIEQYEEIVLAEGENAKFNVNITNDTGALVYYGIWYKLVAPSEMPSGEVITIGKLDGTSVSTSGSINNGSEVTASIGIINDYQAGVKIYVGVASSVTGTSDIEYLNGKELISGVVDVPRDIEVTSIVIDGVNSDYLPTSGYYNMTSSCTKGSTLSWEPLDKILYYENGSKIGDRCSLTFTSSTDYPLLNTMSVGSYVKYVGHGGTVGSTSVWCKVNGESSSNIADVETESPNSCYGQNAREDLDASGYTYGYCLGYGYRYYVTGWRIAYIDDSNKTVIISAGSPECNSVDASVANVNYIQSANAKALKYCNTDYVDGNCSCLDSDSNGLCDSASSDAWAINDTDFYNITKAISGFGKRLTQESSNLGDVGGELGNSLYCLSNYSFLECGYNNDLIDNGGYYYFAARNNSTVNYTVSWSAYGRNVWSYDETYAYGLRPVISLSSTVYVTGGSGTMFDPYTIGI